MENKIKQINKIIPLTCVLVLLSWVPASFAAVSFEELPEKTVFNDFVVGPGKVEAEMEPGESRVFNLIVTNRLGTEKTFNISLEDFTGSNDPNQTVVLLGDDRGPYSLKDFITVGTTSVDIPHSNRVRVSVTVSVPAEAEPGGLYGSVIVGTATKGGSSQDPSGVRSTNPIITRIGTLFFIKIKGNVEEKGRLEKFFIAGNKTILWDSKPVVFGILFKNEGNIHLNPHGLVSVSNLLGSTVGNVEIDPWFAMPQSLRFREVKWKPPFLFGRYVAHASISRGYGTEIDEATMTFWVIPWKIILSVFAALMVIIGTVRWVFSRFTIVSKRR